MPPKTGLGWLGLAWVKWLNFYARIGPYSRYFPASGMISPYCALRNHTPYSLLEGAIPMATLIQRARDYGMTSLGIADSGHLFGALEFSLACQKKGLHPVIGCQVSWIHPLANAPYPLVVFVHSHQGYQNVCRLVRASTVGQPAALRGHVTWDQLKQYNAGLLALTGGIEGALDQLLFRGRIDTAKEVLKDLATHFSDRLYVELQRE